MANWISPIYATPGQDVIIHQDVRSNRDTSVLVDFEVYDSKDQKIWQYALDNQALAGNVVSPLSATFTVPSSFAPGQYTVKTGVFAPGWGPRFAWSDWVGSLIVEAPDVTQEQAPDLPPDATSSPAIADSDTRPEPNAPTPESPDAGA